MPRYAAQPQSLFGGVGAPQPPRAPVDIAGGIDALASGASSLIRQAYERRLAEHNIARQNMLDAQARDQMMYERQRDTRDFQFRQGQEATRVAERQEDLRLKGEAQRRQDLANGIIPAHTEEKDTVVAAPAGTATIAPVNPPSRIRAAMTAPAQQGTPTGAIPPVQVTPSAAPEAPAPEATKTPVYAPAAGTKTVNVPETYDPTRALSYMRTTEAARIRGQVAEEIQGRRAAAQQAGREYMAKAAHDLAAFKATLPSKAGAINRAMTGNKLEDARSKAAIGLISQTNGSYDDAEELLNSADGKALRDLGVEPRHLMYARSEYLKSATGQAIRLQAGALGMDPTEATGAVKTTRELVGGGGKKTPTDTASTPAPSTPPSGGKKPALKTPASAKPAAKDDFTDDEVAEALKAGKTTEDDVRTFITAARKKKGAK